MAIDWSQRQGTLGGHKHLTTDIVSPETAEVLAFVQAEAVEPITDPSEASTEDVATTLNELIDALTAAGLMKAGGEITP